MRQFILCALFFVPLIVSAKTTIPDGEVGAELTEEERRQTQEEYEIVFDDDDEEEEEEEN